MVKNLLFVTSEKDKNTFFVFQKFKNAKVITADKLNTYDILYSHKLIISESAFDQIEKLFKAIIMENIIIKPILTEKMADLGEKLNRYGFEVKTDANKDTD